MVRRNDQIIDFDLARTVLGAQMRVARDSEFEEIRGTLNPQEMGCGVQAGER